MSQWLWMVLADFVRTVQQRVAASADVIHHTASAGDPVYQRMIDNGVDAMLRIAISELDDFRAQVTG